MVGWHYQLNEHEFEQTLEDSEGQGSLACCSPWGRKKSDTTEELNNNSLVGDFFLCERASVPFLVAWGGCQSWRPTLLWQQEWSLAWSTTVIYSSEHSD